MYIRILNECIYIHSIFTPCICKYIYIYISLCICRDSCVHVFSPIGNFGTPGRRSPSIAGPFLVHLVWRTWTSPNQCAHFEKLWSWYCWWTKSCTTKDDDYPIIYRVLTIPGGAGFCPSTVLGGFFMFLHDVRLATHLSKAGGRARGRVGTYHWRKIWPGAAPQPRVVLQRAPRRRWPKHWTSGGWDGFFLAGAETTWETFDNTLFHPRTQVGKGTSNANLSVKLCQIHMDLQALPWHWANSYIQFQTFLQAEGEKQDVINDEDLDVRVPSW